MAGDQEVEVPVVMSNQDVFTSCVGRTVVGVLTDAIPQGRYDEAAGSLALVFDDGTALLWHSRMNRVCRVSVEDVAAVVADRTAQLEKLSEQLTEMQTLAGVDALRARLPLPKIG
jgi:hypothetical protein